MPQDLFALVADLFESDYAPKSVWTPQPKQAQAASLATQTFELLYGGAAGGGKSHFLRCYAVEFALNHPKAHIGIVRKELPMLKKSHGLHMPALTEGLAKHNATENTWTFENGSIIRFVSMNHEGTEQNLKSLEFDLLLFDEVTELPEGQYEYALSRIRSGYQLPCSTCGTKKGHKTGAVVTANPEGFGFKWVKRRWVSPSPEVCGEALPAPFQVWEPRLGNGKYARPRAFVPATVYDNPALLEADPEYIRTLESITDPRKRRALLEGDWTAMDESPGAPFRLAHIDAARVGEAPHCQRVAVAIDPAAGFDTNSDDTGIVVAGSRKEGGKAAHFYVLGDYTCHLPPEGWAEKAIQAYIDHDADFLVAEVNNGGEMVRSTIKAQARQMIQERRLTRMPRVEIVRATRGKVVRAEPVAALYATGRVHHVGDLRALEDQMTSWTPEDPDSPDRMDALVWAVTELMSASGGGIRTTNYGGA